MPQDEGVYPHCYHNFRDEEVNPSIVRLYYHDTIKRCDHLVHLFFDTKDAFQYEDQLASKLQEGEQWEDPDFAADGNSLYLDPYNIPTGKQDTPTAVKMLSKAYFYLYVHGTGALPPLAFDWIRISSCEISGMTGPTLFGMSNVRKEGRTLNKHSIMITTHSHMST